MDAVILRQFEEYLKARGIKAKKTKKTKRSTNNNQPSAAATQPIHKTLSKEEVNIILEYHNFIHYRYFIHLFSQTF